MTGAPMIMTYTSVVSCETVRIALTLATIRTAKQDDKYGASNIILPCLGS